MQTNHTPEEAVPAYNSREVTPNASNLLYRRQFVLGPKSVDGLDGRHGWNALPTTDKLILTVHPDLEIYHVTRGDFTLVLLGYMFDPRRPALTNPEVFFNLTKGNGGNPSFEEVVASTASLCGRWVLLYRNQREVKLFHDPLGSRQIFYHVDVTERWCASQPHAIARQLDSPLSTDPDLLAFVNSPQFAESENTWVDDGTLYAGIKHLLPNHYLDLTQGKAIRYWPSRRLEQLTLEQATQSISNLLKGVLESASKRQELMLAVTAGWDSRVLLAVSKELREQIFYFTQTFGAVSDTHADITVPARLLGKLGLEHHIIKCREDVDPGFREVLYRNVSTIQSDNKFPLYYNFCQQHSKRLNVGTIGSEIGRNYLRFAANPISGEELSASFGRKGDPYTVGCLERWLEKTRSVAEQYGIEINDLFYWEQKMGNWGASWNADLDIATEEFFPFNCRVILETFLGVDKECRKYGAPAIHRSVIEQAWPEALSEPINPHKRAAVGVALWPWLKNRVGARLRRIMK